MRPDPAEDGRTSAQNAGKPLEEIKGRLAALADDVFVADRAYFLLRTPSDFRRQIDEHNLGVLFASLRATLSETFVLRVSRVFEREGRNPPHSIPSMLNYLEVNRGKLAVTQRMQFLQRLRTLGFTAPLPAHASTDEILTSAVVQSFRNTLPDISKKHSCELSQALDSARALRDKRIAHNERIDDSELPATTWHQLDSLLAYAKRFIGVIGWGYAATAYEVDNGRFVLTDDAQAASVALRRLLKMIPGHQQPGRCDLSCPESMWRQPEVGHDFH